MINVGSVTVSGDGVSGIIAQNAIGAININAGSISLEGLGGNGIEMVIGGNVRVDVGSIHGTGDNVCDFGAGIDVVRNSGLVRLTGGKATINGLERFENSGVIDLGDGKVGDLLTLSGDYVGRGDAALRLDVNAAVTASDQLVILGNASGSTRIRNEHSDNFLYSLGCAICCSRCSAFDCSGAIRRYRPGLGSCAYLSRHSNRYCGDLWRRWHRATLVVPTALNCSLGACSSCLVRMAGERSAHAARSCEA